MICAQVIRLCAVNLFQSAVVRSNITDYNKHRLEYCEHMTSLPTKLEFGLEECNRGEVARLTQTESVHKASSHSDDILKSSTQFNCLAVWKMGRDLEGWSVFVFFVCVSTDKNK